MAYGRETAWRWDVIENYMGSFERDLLARYIDISGSHAEMPRITDALLARGWTDHDVRAYPGGDFKRVLGEIWGG